MAAKVKEDDKESSQVPSEILVCWQHYTASRDDEITLNEGDIVELLDTKDPEAPQLSPTSKRIKLDPELDKLTGKQQVLDTSAARHKLSVRPRRTHSSSRHSPNRLNINDRWLVRKISGSKKQGWVPLRILQTADDPVPGGAGLPGDAIYRRQAVVKELVETEQEFVKDLDQVVQNYLIPSESGKVPKIIKDNFDIIFNNLKEIAEFHKTVLMEGVKYYANEPLLLGKAFLRLERDFDKHVNYCRDEPQAQEFLDNCDTAYDYFEEISQRLGDDKNISEHLKLPIQRINDYQLLLKELVRYSACLGEDNSDLQKALDLMLSVPHRAQDDKFTSSIEGYRGSIHKLGRLLAHDRFSITFGDVTKERYLFLFKARILITKVRRISEDRSIFQLKDIIRLPQVILKDNPDDPDSFELVDKVGGQVLRLRSYRHSIKDFWLKEIREFAKDFGESEEEAEEFVLASPPVEDESPKSPPIKKFAQEKAKPLSKTQRDDKPAVKDDLKKPETNPKKDPQRDLQGHKRDQNPKPSTESKVVEKHLIKSSQESSRVELSETHSISTTSTTTDIPPRFDTTITTDLTEDLTTETLKQIQTIDSSSQHLHRIEAVEPLVHLHEPRVLEEVIPYVPPPEPTGSALEKLYCVQSLGVSEVVLTDYKVGIEVNVEVADDMSRRYTSSSSRAAEGYSESSYASRKSASSFTSDGLSSRYTSAETGSSKYGSAESSLGKYDDYSSKKLEDYSKKYDDYSSKKLDDYSSKKYDDYSTKKYDDYSSKKYDDYSSKYSSRKSYSSDNNEGEYSYSRKSRSSALEDDYNRKYKSKYDDDDDLDGKYSSYSRRSIKSSSTYGESGDGDNYSYTRKSYRANAEAIGDGDNVTVRKSYKASLEGTGMDKIEEGDSTSYSYSRKSALEAPGDKYRRSTSRLSDEGSEYSSKYSRRSTSIREVGGDDEEDIYAKYSAKYLRSGSGERADRKSGGEEEDVYAKYTRKYSRSDSKNYEDDSSSKFRRYSRTDSSTERRGEKEKIEEEDPYEKYARKYLRKNSEEASTTDSKRSGKDKNNESTVETIMEKKSTTGEESSKFSSKEEFKESKSYEVESKSYEKSETKEEVKVHEKTATEKLEEIDQSGEDRPHFTKTLRGINIEPGENAYFEISLNKKPTTFTWLKDNKPLNSDENNGRIQFEQVVCDEKHHEYKLLIKQVTITDSGLYTALANNGSGNASCSAQLVVHELSAEERAEHAQTDKPEFLVALKDTELLEDTFLRFMAKIVGEPNPTVTFFKDGVKISENDKHFQIIKEHSDKGFYELVIPNVRKEDAGVYKCVATNKFGEAHSEATLTVTQHKDIFDEMPEGEILPKGEKPVFHWKKDGVPFEPEERFKVLMGDDEDSLALVFQHVKPDDVGLYTCVAQTSRGHISCSAELTVHGTVNQLFREPEKPKLVIEKREPIVTAGGSAMLELQCKGYPKPKVKWTHEGKTIESGEKYKILYEDDETMSLVIKDVKEEDAGKYTITAENELGSDTADMKLTVKVPPKIKTKMEDISAHADLLLKIPVEIEGVPKAKVQFFKDGKEIKSSERIKIVEEGSKHVLVIEKTSLKDTGTYSVVATNELAQVSQYWKLDIHSKPKIIQKLGADRQVSQGEQVELKVKLEAEPKPEVKWFKDEEEIKATDHYVLKEDGDSYILKISGAVTTDAARYKFKAVNIHGSVEDDINIDVKKAPKITKPLVDMIVTEHDKNVTFDVKCEAFPKPTVKWYLDEVEIQETRTEFTKIEVDDGVKLVIKEVTSELSGQYTCKLSNECGTAETSAKLTVNCAPRILKQLKDTTVEEGATLHLEVEVEACPSPTVKWLRNGREVSADARIKITKDTQRHETFNLAVNLIKYEEQGEYEVIVTNSLGTVSSKSYVTVQKVTHTDAIEEVEEPPKFIKVEEVIEEAEAAKVADKHKLEIKTNEEKSEPVKVKDLEDEGPKSNQGKLLAKGKITVEQSDVVQSPEPIIEEPISPKRKTARSAIIEEAEFIEGADSNEEELLKSAIIEDVSNSKPKRGKSLQIEEIEIVENEGYKKSKKRTEEVIIDDDKKLKRAISATKENIEIIDEDEIINGSMKKIQEQNLQRQESKKGISATRETAEIIDESEVDKSRKRIDKIEDIKTESKKGLYFEEEEGEIISVESKKAQIADEDTNKKLKRAISARKESLEVVDETMILAGSKKELKEEKLQRQDSQRGKKSINVDDDDEELNALLNKSQRQRSMVEDYKAEPEAVPLILDHNMKDGSRPESLDVTYIVRGFANPPPVAKWTLNDKEIKPDAHLRMTTSQNGEEFKLEIKKLEMRDAGVYQCTLSNPLGEVSQKAVLEVTPEKELRRPKLKEALKDQTIVKKNSVTFKAVVIGDPIPNVTWLKNGKEISSSEFEKSKMILETEDHDIEDGLKECTYSLTIPRCERFNAGNYKMKAENKWGECESSAELTIILRPEIEGPDDVSVVPGEATEFTVKIQANPVPEVYWMKDDKKVVASDLIKIVEDVANETYKLIFHKVMLADEGYYKVIAKNHLGETSSEARLKTIKETEPSTERPKFITGLNDEQVEHTGEVSVMVRADGLPKPEILWYLNGKEIVQDENHKIETHKETQVTSSLTISNYSESDIGIYKAIARNVVGEAETSSRISMLQTPPSFGKKLERNEDVNEGEKLELKAKVNGSPKPTVAWFKDGEPISPTDENIKTVLLPDGSVKLTIEKAKPGDSGAYKLVVKNVNGETACLCAVAVTQKPRRPKFLKCFKDVKVPVGEPLRLEAQVEAFPPPEIKWTKDGLQVRPSSNVHFENHPDGRIALVVECMKPENAGNYELQVSNKMGEAIGEAKVQIEKRPTKPEFVTKLQPQTVVEGFPVRFEVKAEGFPAPKITWTRNGAEVISDNKHIKITEQPDGTSVLLLDAADQMRDALTYKAIATNEAGEADTSAPLTVKSAVKDEEPEERPMFLHSLKDVITDEGEPLILEAPFTGNPIPSVEWTKDGNPIEPSDRILMTCDGRRVGLRIDKALPSDAGVYGVTISNPLGKESTQGKATVHKVFMAPSFTQRFTDLQQLPGRDAKFPCRVSGVPQPEVTWTKDGEPLRETDKFHMKRDGDACCLYVMNCTPEDAGVYRATATNKEGQDVCTAALEVVKEIKAPQRIEPPVFLKRIGDTELFKSMTAKFTACASGIPEPEVEWYHNDQKLFPSNRIRMDRDQAGLLRLTISGVDVDDLGKYSCKIFNEHGSDICHATLKFDQDMEPKPKRPITDQYTDFDKYKRSGAPVPISDPPIISRMTDRHCTLSWRPSIPSGPRFPVTYQLEMCELPNGDWFTVRSGIRSCTCGVGNLEPFRDYKFRVRVENKYGISDPSPYAITHREKLEPDLPKFVPYLPPDVDFRPDTSPYFPKDFDIERPPHDGMAQAPRFLRQEHDTQYGVKDQNTNLFWFVYGYPKPKMTYYFNDELIEPGGRFDMSYTRNGQATLFINKMLDRDVGWYEAVARNEHGEARQRVRLEIAEAPFFIRRPDIEYVMLRGRAKFEARIVGVPHPEIKWYKDWKPLAPSARIKILFTEPDVTTLIINDVIMKDEGLYSVSARNVAGSASSSAMLHVEENDLEYNLRTYHNLSPFKPKKRQLVDLYDIGDELGRGTQGITYHAVERLNGRNYAAKIMHSRGDLRPFMYNELEILNELRHKKLISLHDCYEYDDSLALILELASGGELVRDYLLRMDYYTESDIAGFIRQLLQGLDYMHSRGYGHMGLNLGDLLISHPGGDDLKITDFGLSRRIQMGHYLPLLYGMPEYVSPECALGRGVGLEHDMWSVGIITFILLSGRSPFRGLNDMETLTNIRSGKWSFDDEWWSRISWEARDFISKLLVFDAEGRLDVHAALRHPWLERADRRYKDDFQISSRYLRDYWSLYREWYDNASCRRWFRRRPLEGAFTHPSRMVYPPGEDYSPRATPLPEKTPRPRSTWEDQLPTRSPLNYEIGAFKSESHYQNGPDTYLLQLRDVDFPVRLREYMKVAANRGPGSGYIISDENGYDWDTPIIRERRRFTDIMDEEIDDERKARINRYGASENSYSIRRLKHELGSRLDTYVEAEAFLESKQEGRLPFFREKPQLTAMIEGKDLELTCFAVGDPKPVVQWFKNDAIVAESHRIKITTDDEGRSHYKLSPALAFDQGMYKVVARNKIGQTIARTRIVLGLVPDEPDSPDASQVSDTEVLLTWKQPRFDGNAPVLCYCLEYKLADDTEWKKKADNIDHEFYLISGLEPNRSYLFRLRARNSIGWSDAGVASAPIQTKTGGSSKIQLSKAMKHLQQITDSGQTVDEESNIRHDYKIENEPIEWQEGNINQNYEIISEISKGKFSTVLKGVDKSKDEIVVIKLLDISGERNAEVEGEFAALRSLRHERIAQLLAAYRCGDTAAFILEKLQGADVLTYLASRHEYTEQTVATIVSQILDGLQYLHWRGLCHLDLQPDNIVMCGIRSVQVKLVDLGAAHRVTKLGTKVPVLGHRDYISPEVLSEEPAFPQTDIWTVGVLTYIMLSGTVPFRGEDENESRQNILFVRYRFEHLYQEVTQEATRFLMLLFKRQPNKRPTPEECHENRWLLPTDYMIKKRERAVFLGHRIKEYSEEYHNEKAAEAEKSSSSVGGKFLRSHSIQEELLTP